MQNLALFVILFSVAKQLEAALVVVVG